MAKVKRHSFFTDYRKKHNVGKGWKVCVPAREFDQFTRPGVTLTGAQRCHSRRLLKKSSTGRWNYADGKPYKQKKGLNRHNRGPFVHIGAV